jgi:hypothetical protein
LYFQLSCLKKLVFSKREGTSQLVTISKKWKNPSSALRRRRTWVQALPWFEICVPKYSALLLYKNSSIRWTFLKLWVV